jgi:hypothetical protein
MLPANSFLFGFEVSGHGRIVHTHPLAEVTGSSTVVASATEVRMGFPFLGAANNISIANVIPQNGSIIVVINTGWSGSDINIKVSGIAVP